MSEKIIEQRSFIHINLDEKYPQLADGVTLEVVSVTYKDVRFFLEQALSAKADFPKVGDHIRYVMDVYFNAPVVVPQEVPAIQEVEAVAQEVPPVEKPKVASFKRKKA